MVLEAYGDPPAQMASVTSFRQHPDKRLEREEIKTWFGVLSFVEKWEDQLQTLSYLQSVLVLTSRPVWNPPAERCIFQGTPMSWISWKNWYSPFHIPCYISKICGYRTVTREVFLWGRGCTKHTRSESSLNVEFEVCPCGNLKENCHPKKSR